MTSGDPEILPESRPVVRKQFWRPGTAMHSRRAILSLIRKPNAPGRHPGATLTVSWSWGAGCESGSRRRLPGKPFIAAGLPFGVFASPLVARIRPMGMPGCQWGEAGAPPRRIHEPVNPPNPRAESSRTAPDTAAAASNQLPTVHRRAKGTNSSCPPILQLIRLLLRLRRPYLLGTSASASTRTLWASRWPLIQRTSPPPADGSWPS